MEKSNKPVAAKGPARSNIIKASLAVACIAIVFISLISLALYMASPQLDPDWLTRLLIIGAVCLVCYLVIGPDKF